MDYTDIVDENVQKAYALLQNDAAHGQGSDSRPSREAADQKLLSEAVALRVQGLLEVAKIAQQLDMMKDQKVLAAMQAAGNRTQRPAMAAPIAVAPVQ